MAPALRLRVLRHRWYVVVLGLVLTLALGFGATKAVKPTYKATSVLLLLPPSGGKGDNPYLNLGAISGVTDVLNRALSGPDIDAQMRAQGLDGSFEITPDTSSSGPLVDVTGTAKTQAEAISITLFAAELIPGTLKQLQQQAGVLDNAVLITSTVINKAQKASAVRSSQTRAVIAAVALGILLTILLAALVERLTTQRRETDEVDEADEADDADEASGGGDADLLRARRERPDGRPPTSGDSPPYDHLEATS